MCDRWGVARVLAPLIANLPQSESFDAALRATYHVTQSDFEERWQRDVGSRYGWLSLAGAPGLFLVPRGSVPGRRAPAPGAGGPGEAAGPGSGGKPNA